MEKPPRANCSAVRYVSGHVTRRPTPVVILLAVLALGLTACGSKKETETDALSEQVQTACTADAMIEAPKLPPSFPQIEADKVT